MKSLKIILVAAATLIVSFASPAKIKVACIGNSITYGAGLPNALRLKQCYPSVLQELLGDDYVVGNFGRSGATLLRNGHRSYFKLAHFKEALAMQADIAVIHLGVNDTDPRDWPNYSDEFITDYSALIDSLRKVNPDVRIIIARLTPIGAKHYRFRTGTHCWRLLAQKAIENVAKHKGVELIDFNIPLRDRQNLMPDAIHPDATGYKLLAQTVYKGITGDYGGLSLSPLFQSGMVLQRHKPLTISGKANAGDTVTLTLDAIPYTCVANNRGEWSVETAPLADGAYTMTVTDGNRTITLTDILAGEVWVASGQSNMEFKLNNSTGSKADIAKADDSLLRFYNMTTTAYPANKTWDDATITAVDTLGYFTPATWQKVTAKNAGELSAVAYYFAKQLRDSLNVPVGIISNAVGGSPCESWIDINTLEAQMPEILIDWRHNDYVQKWAQGRAEKNASAPHRHPYEPSYLFSAGIRPLGQPDIAGVIWYQGESNAHNIELHEQLFPMLLQSWRQEFRRSDLPVCFVQLSSLNRPSWPTFRDSQRRMANELDNVYMAVSSDHGDTLDVHPRNKRPIGQRLALQALKNIYGFHHLTAQGPMPIKAVAAYNGSVTLTFSNAIGLHTSDGNTPLTFELADETEVFHPAKATILSNNQLLLSAEQVSKPLYVRYGWQPFTRANLVNGNDLPTSTFKIKIDNMNQLHESEPGYERGVSACFAGQLPDGRNIMAGGANFPCDDPLAPTAQKKLYAGIYQFDGNNRTRVGTLPEPIAYGASVSTPKGIMLIGGTTDNGSTATVSLITPNLTIEQLPSLPHTIDNMAAAAIESMIYVAGGNVDGTPSRNIFALDLNNLEKGWSLIGSMPGNPRVQPVMAASADKLYIWGGFAGRHNGNEPTLELNGLCYNPANGSWTEIDGPRNADGVSVATGGGIAATLKSGVIAVAGGVNKDVFLSALINQAPDYLNHPIEWYAFNPTIFYFDPATSTWSIGQSAAIQARAGAAAIASDNELILIGGELKPRIRTNQTITIKR